MDPPVNHEALKQIMSLENRVPSYTMHVCNLKPIEGKTKH